MPPCRPSIQPQAYPLPGCCQFSANHFRRGNAAAGTINTQNNRFHFRVKASVADLCRSGITANIPLSFLAIHNCAISEDDTDTVTGICRRFQCVIVITDGAIILSVLLQPNSLVRVFSISALDASASTSLFSSAYFAVSPPVWLNPQATLARQGIPAEQGSGG